MLALVVASFVEFGAIWITLEKDCKFFFQKIFFTCK
jgi:hypothetical protein